MRKLGTYVVQNTDDRRGNCQARRFTAAVCGVFWCSCCDVSSTIKPSFPWCIFLHSTYCVYFWTVCVSRCVSVKWLHRWFLWWDWGRSWDDVESHSSRQVQLRLLFPVQHETGTIAGAWDGMQDLGWGWGWTFGHVYCVCLCRFYL